MLRVGVVSISTDEGNSTRIDVLVGHGKPLGFDLLLGVDTIKALGCRCSANWISTARRQENYLVCSHFYQ